ncbi:acetyltransferase [Paenibacillus paeoniae]|uniref:Acetyltransferase n=1 Tax=Paenibacillus paeoniae TaxID=2292705 RepID=A0A371PKG8_9BACL|nr:acetyltransferase [Paenibacillus paeoniae]REK76698.1 acetyltransferase [Paenibacillus paeoniae]
MTYPIVAYQNETHDQLVDIWHRAVRATHHFLTEQDIQFFYSMVSGGALAEVEIWTAVDQAGKPLGFIGLEDKKIEMLFVDPLSHGLGIGKALLNHAIQLKGNDIEVDVNEQNEGAHTFYLKCGFQQIGRSPLDGSGKPFPLLHLKLRSK